jgi:hypothetical protein
VELAREQLAGRPSGARFASGTDTDFIFLQRTPPPLELLDLVAFAINPQAHAFDNASIVETLEAQAAAVKSARRLAGGLPVMVSPVTLRPRHNPYATGAAPETPPGVLPPQVDPRQMSLLGAGWTLGSLRALAEGRAHRLTFYETTGWRGVMETEGGSPLPELFHSIPGGVFPLYHILADAADFVGTDFAGTGSAGEQVLTTHSTDGLRANGLALRRGEQVRLLLANYTAQRQAVEVKSLGQAPRARVRMLDEECAEFAMRSPEAYRARPGVEFPVSGGDLRLELPPYAVARVDIMS